MNFSNCDFPDNPEGSLDVPQTLRAAAAPELLNTVPALRAVPVLAFLYTVPALRAVPAILYTVSG